MKRNILKAKLCNPQTFFLLVVVVGSPSSYPYPYCDSGILLTKKSNFDLSFHFRRVSHCGISFGLCKRMLLYNSRIYGRAGESQGIRIYRLRFGLGLVSVFWLDLWLGYLYRIVRIRVGWPYHNWREERLRVASIVYTIQKITFRTQNSVKSGCIFNRRLLLVCATVNLNQCEKPGCVVASLPA